MDILEKAARIILNNCLNLKSNESLLLISDGSRPEFSKILLQQSQKLGVHSAFMEIPLNGHYRQEPAEFIANIMSQSDVLILITQYPLSRTKACQTASSHKTRIISLVNVQDDILKRIVETKYDKVQAITQKLADILTIGKSLSLTTQNGSNFHLSLVGVKGHASYGVIQAPGQNSSLPAGETFCTPVLNSGMGKLVIDGSVEFIGPLQTPIQLKVVGGMIKRISGGSEAERLRKQIKPFGSKARQIIGFGMGANESAQFGLSVQEDKKVMGTAHISFGNTFMFDKSGRLPNRIDAIIKRPTVIIDGKTIIEKGHLKITSR